MKPRFRILIPSELSGSDLAYRLIDVLTEGGMVWHVSFESGWLSDKQFTDLVYEIEATGRNKDVAYRASWVTGEEVQPKRRSRWSKPWKLALGLYGKAPPNKQLSKRDICQLLDLEDRRYLGKVITEALSIGVLKKVGNGFVLTENSEDSNYGC